MGASVVESRILASSGAATTVPLTSVLPPPGIVIAALTVAGPTDGQVKFSTVTATSVSGSVVTGDTARSSKVTVPLSSARRSRLRPQADAGAAGPGLFGAGVPGGAGVAGALIGGADAPLASAGRPARASRSIRPSGPRI